VKQNIFRILIVNICVFAVLWGCAEIICYFFAKKVESSSHIFKDDLFSILDGGEYEKDQDMLFKLKPNKSFYWGYDVKHQTGKEGWRIGSKRINNVIEPDIKIVVVGDSCTFGLGVSYDKTYGAVLEEKIKEEINQKTRVYNFGVPGFTSFQSKKLLEKVVPSLRPAIIICYLGANDGAPAMEYSDKEYYENINIHYRSFIYRLLRYSNVFKLLQAKRYKTKIQLLEESIEHLPQDTDWFKLSLPDLMIELEQRGITLDKNIFNKNRTSKDEFKQNLLSIKELAKKYNAIFIYIPNIWNDGNNLHYNEDYLCINYLDIRERLEKYKTEDVFIDTVHPTVKGHSVIAEMIFEFIFKIL